MVIMNTKAKLYFAAVMGFVALLVITSIFTHAGIMSVYELCWQTIVSMLGGLWFWNLLRIEMTRAARRRR